MILLLDACCFSWWLWWQWTLWLIAYCRLGLLIPFLVTIFQFQFWYTGDWNISCVLCLWLSLLYPPGQGLFSVHLFQFQFGDQGDWNVSSVLCLWVLLLHLHCIMVFSVKWPEHTVGQLGSSLSSRMRSGVRVSIIVLVCFFSGFCYFPTHSCDPVSCQLMDQHAF